jgi:excisionase family DNA binding protein
LSAFTVPIDGASTAPQHPAASVQPLAISIRDAVSIAGISRSLLYQEIAAGRLRSLRIGARRLLLLDDLRDWLTAHRDSGLPPTSRSTETGPASPSPEERARQNPQSVARNLGGRGVGR